MNYFLGLEVKYLPDILFVSQAKYTKYLLEHTKIVGPQALLTLLKAIAVRKGAYPNLIVHSPKRPRQTQGEFMDAANPPICQQSPPPATPLGFEPVTSALIPLVGPQVGWIVGVGVGLGFGHI